MEFEIWRFRCHFLLRGVFIFVKFGPNKKTGGWIDYRRLIGFYWPWWHWMVRREQRKVNDGGRN